MHHIARQIYAAIQKAKNIVLIPHANPDGDALGSVTAALGYLISIGKSPRAFCATGIGHHYRYLAYLDLITSDPSIWKQETFDLIIVFDSGDLRYAGVADHIDSLSPKPMIINIDHHATNEQYGAINMVDAKASSTAEVLHRFFRYNQIPVDRRMATSILTGLMTDTDNFTNAATSPSSLSIASDMIIKGADVAAIRSHIFKNKSLAALKLWGIALMRLEKNEVLKIAYTYLTQKDVRETHAGENDIEGIANFLSNLNNIDSLVSMILKELPDGRFKGSFRTTRNDIDVSAWAKALGSGGHKKAAGFSVEGPIIEAFTKIWSEIKN